MKSNLKKIDIESLLNFIKVIENKTIKEKINDDVERIVKERIELLNEINNFFMIKIEENIFIKQTN